MNLFLHSAIYGYKPDFAIPSLASGTISYDFSGLSVATNIKSTSIVFGIVSSNSNEYKTEIAIDDNTVFSSSAIYSFNCEDNQYQAVISREDGTVITIPSSSPVIEVPLYDFKQESLENIETTLPSYSYNSYYTYSFSVDTGYISNINVYVKEADSDTYKEYSVDRVKYLKEAGEEVVFFNKVSDNSYTIDFGSGVHGKWIPGASVKIIVHKTFGAASNLSQDIKCTINSPTQAFQYHETDDGTVVPSTTIGVENFTVKFNYASGGINPLSGESLRKAIVKYIQTRDNFISEQDFYNIIEKYTTDFRLLHKKTTIQENIIYVLRGLRDEYQVPVRSMNLMPTIFTKTTTINNITYKDLTTGSLTPGEYYYKIYAYDTFGNIIASNDIGISLLESTQKGIELNWDSVDAALKYRLFVRGSIFTGSTDIVYSYYIDLTSSTYIDTGDNSALVEYSESLPDTTVNTPVVFPVISYNGTDYISPFLYKFNDVYNFYEGYLFYPELIVNFSSIVQETGVSSIISSIHPSIYLSIIYDSANYKSTIYLKSYQELSSWTFKITSPELGITELAMTEVDSTSYSYTYSTDLGILPENTTISILCYNSSKLIFTARTAKLTQCYSLSDQMQFPVYTLNGISYLIDVPVLKKDKFVGDEEYYLDKIYDFVVGFNFEENRMISDNIAFRFLNTNGLYSFLLVNAVKQGGNLFKYYNYISTVTPFASSTEPTYVPENGFSWIIASDESIPIVSTVVVRNSDGIYETFAYGGDVETSSAETDVSVLPYLIILSGDYRSIFKSLDNVRIKDANNGMNGCYRITSVAYDSTNNQTALTTFNKLPISVGQGNLYYASYEAWRAGGPDNIATWNAETKSWIFTDVNPGDLVTVSDKSISKTFVYNNNYAYSVYGLILPLLLSVTLDIDKDAVVKYNINLESARDQLKLELAKYLQLFLTGTDISYYPSALIEFIMEQRSAWIKHTKISVTDSDGKALKDGLEALPEKTIMHNIGGSKLDMLNYTSAYYHWDVDNIKITYIS